MGRGRIMGQPTSPGKAVLIVGMISGVPELMGRAESALTERFGPVMMQSRDIPFNFTNYYEREMGPELTRRFLAFGRRIDPGAIADIKLWTNAAEEWLPGPDRSRPRPINLDPGYVDLSKLVLATTKDHAHRIYLRKGIYAEVTLSYVDGKFRPMPWTYPDYRTEEYRLFFEQVRAKMKELSEQRN